MIKIIWKNLFGSKSGLKPKNEIPTLKTNLHEIDPSENVLVWFGHSSTFMQVEGKRILIDPVLSKYASPVSFYNRSFKGTNIYSPDDIPPINYLIISHDHWDHLDYPTMKALRHKIDKIICPLGVGAHFERWKFDKSRIIEMDWHEDQQLDSTHIIYCLPARHFSGRSLSPNKTLWASYLIQTPLMNIYIGGDSGYDTHFTEIGRRFPKIDIAILENGQYDKNWKYIHATPEEVLYAAKDLNATYILPVHSGKFKLANHPWDEPLSKITESADDSVQLLTPMIGEKVDLNKPSVPYKKWWKMIE